MPKARPVPGGRVHAALGKDAQSVFTEPAETFRADRFARFADRFGTPWRLSHTGAKTMA